MSARPSPTPWPIGLASLTLVAALLWAGPARALDPNDEMPPGYDTTDWFDAWFDPADNSYHMYKWQEPEFVLKTWFAAAFGDCAYDAASYPPVEDAYHGWGGKYYSDWAAGQGHTFPPGFPNPATGDASAGLLCHWGRFAFEYEPIYNDRDKLFYIHNTEGEDADGHPFAYGGTGDPDVLYWHNELTGTPIIYLRDAQESGGNWGHMFYWPMAGIDPDPPHGSKAWEDAMYILGQAYYCQDDVEACAKDVFTYEGLGAYWIKAYYQITGGVDSNWAWDGETHPGTPPQPILNDFNIIYTPQSGDRAHSFLLIQPDPNPNDGLDEWCACGLESNWYGVEPEPPPGTPVADCDDNIQHFNQTTDYPLALLRAADMCLGVDDPAKTPTVNETRFGTRQYNLGAGTTTDSSTGVVVDYGTEIESETTERLAILSTGKIGDTGDIEWGAEQWTSGADGYVDYILPPEYWACEVTKCCVQESHTQPNNYFDNKELHDWSKLEFSFVVPDNIYGVSFDFLFVTSEFPEYVDETGHNDGFEAIVETVRAVQWEQEPTYPGYTCDTMWTNGTREGNVSFDSQGFPIRINNDFFTEWGCDVFNNGAGVLGHHGTPDTQLVDMWSNRCNHWYTYDCCNNDDPVPTHCYTYMWYEPKHSGVEVCPHNPSMNCSGYWWDGGFCPGHSHENTSGSTGWLTTQFPVWPGETVTMRWGIFDRADARFDSFAVVDNWTWLAGDPGTPTTFKKPTDAFLGSPFGGDEDNDGDGFSFNQGDCNDSNPAVCPDPVQCPEIPNDCLDNDCDGQLHEDEDDDDGDGHFPCVGLEYYDCDETDATIHSHAPEICDDKIDNDCDNDIDAADNECGCQDLDGDGFGYASDPACTVGPYDCDDGDPYFNPIDFDGDGYSTCTGDCNDRDPNVNQGMLRDWGNGRDGNCSGMGLVYYLGFDWGNEDVDYFGTQATVSGDITTDCADNPTTGWCHTKNGDRFAWDCDNYHTSWYGNASAYNDRGCWQLRDNFFSDTRTIYFEIPCPGCSTNGSDFSFQWKSLFYWETSYDGLVIYRRNGPNNWAVQEYTENGDWFETYFSARHDLITGSNPNGGELAYTNRAWGSSYDQYDWAYRANDYYAWMDFEIPADEIVGIAFEGSTDGSVDRWGASIDNLELYSHDLDYDSYVGWYDCDEHDPYTHVFMNEVCDGMAKDNDCDGAVNDELDDEDNDGLNECEGDCDDHDASVYPGAPGEVANDYIDTNCNGNDDN